MSEVSQDVVSCLEWGWSTTGARVQQFSEALKDYLDAPFVIPLVNATAGLHLALLAMDIQPGDEVITTPMTFAATLNTIVLAGAKPVLVDIDPATCHLDLDQLEDAITDKTRIVMPVHFAGLPIDLDHVYDIAAKHSLRVIENAVHAMGAEYGDIRIGGIGDTQVFSFHSTRNLTTGEGGCVVTRDERLAKKINCLRSDGIDREAWYRHGKNGSEDYEVVMPGFQYNMMDIQAAMGSHQLQKLDQFIDRRMELAERYQAALADWSQWTLPSTPSYAHRHAWHIYTPLINPACAGMSRDDFRVAMQEKNIATDLHYRAVHLDPYYRERFGFSVGDFPNAENVAERMVSLPLFASMTDAEHDRILDVMYSIFN